MHHATLFYPATSCALDLAYQGWWNKAGGRGVVGGTLLPRVRFISIGVIELSAFGYGCQAHCPIPPPLCPTHFCLCRWRFIFGFVAWRCTDCDTRTLKLVFHYDSCLQSGNY